MVKLDRRLSRPDAEIAFADTGGTGPTVVLTHGAGINHTMFDAQAAALQENGCRIITWDLRGHGQSELAPGTRFTAPHALADLHALLALCAVRAPVIVGHSFGGNLAQAFVRAHPQHVRALVVMGATWNYGPLSALERAALHLAAPMLAAVPAARLPLLMARASAHTPEAVQRCQEVFAHMPKAKFLDVWKATLSLVQPGPVPDPRRGPRMDQTVSADPRSAVPLALVRGEHDQTGNIAVVMPRWAAAEGVVEHVVAGAGHVLTWDAPERTSGVLVQILRDWGVLEMSSEARDD